VNDILLVVVVVIALGFDFTNGIHDTANAIATSVGTRAVTPRVAVLIAAVANLAGAFVTTAVAKSIATGIIDGNLATQQTLVAALIGAIAWNLLTWWFGLPSSSSHALIGGLIGAALVQSGEKGVLWHGVAHKVVIPAVFAPAIAFVAAFLVLLGVYWVFSRLNPGIASRGFRLGQLGTGTWVAFTHGANDAQKTMGVIALALVLHSHGDVSNLNIPTWVKVAAGLAIGVGTYVGGWRIIRTLGQGVFRMEPESGFAAQAAGGHHDLPRDEVRLPVVDDPRHLGRRDGCGRDQASLGGPLGRGRQHRRGVGAHHPRRSSRRRSAVLAGTGHFLSHLGDRARHRVPICARFTLLSCGRSLPPGRQSNQGGTKEHEHSLDHPHRCPRARAARLLLARPLVGA
jgi:PiT family inorganic phosphate transporter